MDSNANMTQFKEDFNNQLLSKSAFNNLLNKNDINEELHINGDLKISIIILTYNRCKQLTECINSILKQTYSNFEIIIIDDCSTDETNSLYINHKDKRIKYIRSEGKVGIGLNRQKGYNLSTGDIVIYVDDDDYFIDNTYFEDIYNIFKDEGIDVVCSNSYIYYEKENKYQLFKLNLPRRMSCLEYLSKFGFELKKPTSTFPVAFRKTILEKSNFSDMKMMNDSSIYLRALLSGNEVYFNNKIIGIYRLHEKNYTFNVIKADFIIENFNEKKYVYEHVKNKIKSPLKWFEKEISITACYFLNGKENRKSEIDKIFNWVRNNVSYKLFLYLKLYKVKSDLKKKLKE